ncbi:MAG: hypothetical protein ACKVXR_11810 [Planctomycetota bacterium]
MLGFLVTVVAISAGTWREDPVWYDGLAEKCTYEATRTIYGVERKYVASFYTDKERADPRTMVKTEGEEYVLVFKHHAAETVPTENYDYRYSTMSYVRADDLAPFKLTASTQDDCGASFKELWRDEGRLRWSESVYFPGGGRREGAIELRKETIFFDALTLTLRDYPFDSPKEMKLRVVPSQKDVHRVPFEAEERTVRYAGASTESLPIGEIPSHRLELLKPDGSVEARFWFAADGKAPRLHVLVRYEGPQGIKYRLASMERTAYWHR